MTAAPSVFDDDELASLEASYQQGHGDTLDEARLYSIEKARQLRLMRARHEAKQAFDEELAAATDDDRAAPLNWADFLNRDLSAVEWVTGRILAASQHISLVGEGKAGKSLLCLEWAWRAAAGLPFLGDQSRDPIRVLYVDQENSHDDLQARLRSLGATRDQLENLVYLSFPAFRPLTTAGGGADLLRAIEKHGATLVFLDTISRMVEGKENDSDPWLGLYRYTLQPMKSAGIGSVRLDHFGKDLTRGSRGSSAKNQDVDHVWELRATEDGPLKLNRTHTRTGIGPDYFDLWRLGEKDCDRWAEGKTRHVLATSEEAPEMPALRLVGEVAKKIAGLLDGAGLPSTVGRPKAREWLTSNGHRCADAVLMDALKFRQERAA